MARIIPIPIGPIFPGGSCGGIIHVIQKGDTLYQLGKRYHVSVGQLMFANPFVDVYNLQIGDELCIPATIQPRAVGAGERQQISDDRNGMQQFGNWVDQEEMSDQEDMPNQRNWMNQGEMPDQEDWSNQEDMPNQRNWSNQEDMPNQRNWMNQGEMPDQEDWSNQEDMSNRQNWSDQKEVPGQENWIDQEEVFSHKSRDEI